MKVRKRIIALVVVMAASAAFAAPALAWHVDTSGKAVCDTETGKYAVTWIADNWKDSHPAVVDQSNRTAVAVGTKIPDVVTFPDSVSGSSTSATLEVKYVWSDSDEVDQDKVVLQLDGDCAKPPPPPPPPAVDKCPNIKGNQSSVPDDRVKVNGKCVRKFHPKGAFLGPCGDPMHGAVFNNTHSYRAVTFKFSFLRFGVGWDSVTHHVGAHQRYVTGWQHVTGKTMMTITAKYRGRWHFVKHKLSAAAGNYPACK